MAMRADIDAVLASGFFDLQWYRDRWPAAGPDLEAAVAHFLDAGAAEGWDPGPGFSLRRYLRANPDVAAAGMNPLLHYLAHGRAEGRDAYPVEEGEAEELPLPDPARHARELALLQGSPLFDAHFYLDNNEDVRVADVDPLRHFVEHGASEGRWPNPWFDTTWYRRLNQVPGDPANALVHYALSTNRADAWTSEWFDGGYYRKRYPDAAKGDTPLGHFLEHGVESGRQTRAPLGIGPGRIQDPGAVRTTVVVTVHNAEDHVRRCLESVFLYTRFGEGDSLLVIDDASDQPGIAALLGSLQGRTGVRVVRNERNLGYTRSANLGCRLAGTDDVVLLNSDTVVGPHWLRNLKIAATRRTRIGTATAVSGNAGAFSVPREGTNDPPTGVTGEAWARAVADVGAADFEVPTGNGFCMYLRRQMLDDVGGFDEARFPLGYGEENDLCMRALSAGWHHLVVPTVFVAHARSASFADRRETLSREGSERLRQLHPDYPVAAAGLPALRGFVLARYRIARKWRALSAGGRVPRPRILYVLSTDSGGIPRSNADLMRVLGGRYDCLAMRCDGKAVELSVLDGADYRVLERHALTEPLGLATHVGEEYEAVVRDLLLRHSVDLLHIRHLAWHSLNLARVAKGMGVPVVQSLHDYYSICPTVNLLDRAGCLHEHGVADDGENALWPHDPAAAVPMTADRLQAWQGRMERALLDADALVTTSESARGLLLAAFPALVHAGQAVHVIPHGRDFERFGDPAAAGPLADDEPMRILLLGNIGLHKGAALVAEVAATAPPGKLEFHLLGTGHPVLEGRVVDHGPYRREVLAARIAEIRPHIAAIPSLAPETWCHTLTECWAAGLPVIALDRGAVGERLREHRGGWLLPGDAGPDLFLRRLLEIRSGSERAAAAREVAAWQAGAGAAGTTSQMGERYEALYATVLSRIHPSFP